MAPAPVFPYPVVQWGSVPEALNDMAPVLTLCPSVVPIAFSSFVPDDSVQRWLTSALPLVLAPNETAMLQPVPVNSVVTAAKSRKLKTTGRKTRAAGVATKGRSPKLKAKTAAP